MEEENYKDQGNELFKKGQYKLAIEKYDLALKCSLPNQVDFAPIHANRSFAYLKIEMYGAALRDATASIQYDQTYSKGYYRRAAANTALGKHKEALADLRKVAQLVRDDKFIHGKIKACERIIHQIGFEKAIAVETRKPLAFTLDCDSIPIEDSYRGPHLDEQGKVTLGFVHELLAHYKELKVLHRKYALKILCSMYEYFIKQPSLIDITIPKGKKFTVCGDIHGQFFDLLNIFELNGLPSDTNPYLFNGDVVDRGSFSIECILLLFSLKLLYPDHFYISRGNHETHSMNQMYGFEGECKAKYSHSIYDLFSEVFQVLPLAHCINNKILVVHGGLCSSETVTLDDIRKLDRNRQPPEDGVMCELLWSDPMPQPGTATSKRGIAIAFGPDVTEKFCKRNNLDYIIRSHEVKMLGYEKAHNDKCITVFSAPNYCDNVGNEGAFIILKGDKLENPEFVRFEAVPHPDMKPMAYANPLINLL